MRELLDQTEGADAGGLAVFGMPFAAAAVVVGLEIELRFVRVRHWRGLAELWEKFLEGKIEI